MNTTPTGFACSPRIYEYERWLFEVHGTGEPWPLKKNGDRRVTIGQKFYAMYGRFRKEPDREKFRVGGGCQPI